ncbi:MAG: hypothetical protein AAGC81_03720 [Pseudomonadota bacterium]
MASLLSTIFATLALSGPGSDRAVLADNEPTFDEALSIFYEIEDLELGDVALTRRCLSAIAALSYTNFKVPNRYGDLGIGDWSATDEERYKYYQAVAWVYASREKDVDFVRENKEELLRIRRTLFSNAALETMSHLKELVSYLKENRPLDNESIVLSDVTHCRSAIHGGP